jgi:mono/diheme cytochrome c family protein
VTARHGTTALALAATLMLAVPAPQAQPPHAGHGTPPGWTFRWPAGDPARGRQVFVRLECYGCHEVKGERFPAPGETGKVGPELAAMGPLHEAEYFAEAIVNPSAVIEPGKGYEAPDGSSRMPSYNDTVTVQEVADLVAFLRSLRPPPAGGPLTPAAGNGHPPQH